MRRNDTRLSRFRTYLRASPSGGPRSQTSRLDKGEAAVDCSHLHERSVLQAISAAALPSRFHYSQFQSARGAGREQDGFQPAARHCRVRSGRRRALPRDRAPDASGTRQLLLFELDPDFSRDLERQFANDPRVHVINGDAAQLAAGAAAARDRRIAITSFPAFRSAFSISRRNAPSSGRRTKRSRPAAAFIIYQVTNELRQHATLVRSREVRVFPAKHPADVHHGVSQSATRGTATAIRATNGGADSGQSTGMTPAASRTEKDSMGEMSVPESALYGASTQRAVLNFPVSGYRFPRPFIRALGLLEMGGGAGESRSRSARCASLAR